MPDDVSAVTDRRYSIVMRRYPRIFSPETFGSNGPAALPLFCLAPHGVFRASRITLRAVSSYLAFSPLPALFSKNRRCLFCDTLRHRNFSTAAPAFFTRHAAVWCSDFPPANRKNGPPAIICHRLLIYHNQQRRKENPRVTRIERTQKVKNQNSDETFTRKIVIITST